MAHIFTFHLQIDDKLIVMDLIVKSICSIKIYGHLVCLPHFLSLTTSAWSYGEFYFGHLT